MHKDGERQQKTVDKLDDGIRDNKVAQNRRNAMILEKSSLTAPVRNAETVKRVEEVINRKVTKKKADRPAKGATNAAAKAFACKASCSKSLCTKSFDTQHGLSIHVGRAKHFVED